MSVPGVDEGAIQIDRIDQIASTTEIVDPGLSALAMIAGYYRIGAEPAQLRHQLALFDRASGPDDIMRAARLIGLKSREVNRVDAKRIERIPVPASIGLRSGGFAVLSAGPKAGTRRVVDVIARTASDLSIEDLLAQCSGTIILITRRLGGAGHEPKTFGFAWFLPSLWRYRQP